MIFEKKKNILALNCSHDSSQVQRKIVKTYPFSVGISGIYRKLGQFVCSLFATPKIFFLLDVVGRDRTKDCCGIQDESLTSRRSSLLATVQYISLFFPVIAGVVDTGDQTLLSNFSANFCKNSKWPHRDTQGPEGN
jgi:hypothetical protein